MRFLPVALTCLLAASPALPALALPAAAPIIAGDYHLHTAITAVYGSQYPTTGDIDLHISPDGLVSGYYHPAGVRAFVPVVGGLSGDRIWFDIGLSPRLHVTGTVGDAGTIQAGGWSETTVANSAAASSRTFDSPASVLPAQFTFAAGAR